MEGRESSWWGFCVRVVEEEVRWSGDSGGIEDGVVYRLVFSFFTSFAPFFLLL